MLYFVQTGLNMVDSLTHAYKLQVMQAVVYSIIIYLEFWTEISLAMYDST